MPALVKPFVGFLNRLKSMSFNLGSYYKIRENYSNLWNRQVIG